MSLLCNVWHLFGVTQMTEDWELFTHTSDMSLRMVEGELSGNCQPGGSTWPEGSQTSHTRLSIPRTRPCSLSDPSQVGWYFLLCPPLYLVISISTHLWLCCVAVCHTSFHTRHQMPGGIVPAGPGQAHVRYGIKSADETPAEHGSHGASVFSVGSEQKVLHQRVCNPPPPEQPC